MFCGSFSHVDDDDQWQTISSLPRRSRRKEKNPYANRGLDKFATVLADLEARREKIMAKMGAQDGFLVRFAQSNLRDWVPIIVKVRDPKQQKIDAVSSTNKLAVGSKEVVPAAVVSEGRMKKRFSWSVKNMQTPSYYWPLVMVLILLCLVTFGRSFAILCISIWWYVMPTSRGGNVNMGRSMNKNYVRRLSEKNLGGDGRLLQAKMGHGRITS